MSDDLLEKLAALEHERWAKLTRHTLEVLGPCLPDGAARAFMLDFRRGDGHPPEVAAAEAMRRWYRQIATPYANLSEAEKEGDREWARKVLEVVRADS